MWIANSKNILKCLGNVVHERSVYILYKSKHIEHQKHFKGRCDFCSLLFTLSLKNVRFFSFKRFQHGTKCLIN